jgi:hypothetical protein
MHNQKNAAQLEKYSARYWGISLLEDGAGESEEEFDRRQLPFTRT